MYMIHVEIDRYSEVAEGDFRLIDAVEQYRHLIYYYNNMLSLVVYSILIYDTHANKKKNTSRANIAKTFVILHSFPRDRVLSVSDIGVWCFDAKVQYNTYVML